MRPQRGWRRRLQQGRQLHSSERVYLGSRRSSQSTTAGETVSSHRARRPSNSCCLRNLLYWTPCSDRSRCSCQSRSPRNPELYCTSGSRCHSQMKRRCIRGPKLWRMCQRMAGMRYRRRRLRRARHSGRRRKSSRPDAPAITAGADIISCVEETKIFLV
jgi:hypothetical protein